MNTGLVAIIIILVVIVGAIATRRCMEFLIGGSIVAALVLLMVMAFGVVEIQDDWAEYRATENYISSLNMQNSQLKLQYQQGYDLEEVKSKALGLGLVPVEEVKTMTINVTVPEPRHEETLKERILWFWNGLWE